MKRTLFISLLLCITSMALGQYRVVAQSAILGPFTTAVNFSIDLAGTPDNTPGIWGSDGAAQNIMVFAPPAGYRVRVLQVSGDFVGWPKSGVISPGTFTEIGWGLKTTAAQGSVYIPGVGAYDNSIVWVQDGLSVTNQKTRASYIVDTHIGGLLGTDNTLVSQAFVALNTTGLTIHMEPTFVITYQFEVQQ